jgi:hypothetical protein
MMDFNELSFKEFASLLVVANARIDDPAPVIPTKHSAKLIALGYIADLEGRLRVTTPGRSRTRAGQQSPDFNFRFLIN